MKPLREIFEKSSFLGWPLFGSARWPGGIFYPVVFFNSVHPVIGPLDFAMFLGRKRGQNEKLPKHVQKVSPDAFWGFLAASQKNVQKVSGKCPGAGVGAGKMSRKYKKKTKSWFLPNRVAIFVTH